MAPSTTDQKAGTVSDGKARSAQWRAREAELEADKARKAAEARNGHDSAAADARYAPPTNLVSSLLIPADQIPLDSASPSQADGEDSSSPGPPEVLPDLYMSGLIERSAAEHSATAQPSGDRDDTPTDIDSYFEEQATAPPRAIARHHRARHRQPPGHRHTRPSPPHTPPHAPAADPGRARP